MKKNLYLLMIFFISNSFAGAPVGDIGVCSKLNNSTELRCFQLPTLNVPLDNTYNQDSLSGALEKAVGEYLIFAEDGQLINQVFFDAKLMTEGIKRFTKYWMETAGAGKVEHWGDYTFTYSYDASEGNFRYKKITATNPEGVTVAKWEGRYHGQEKSGQED